MSACMIVYNLVMLYKDNLLCIYLLAQHCFYIYIHGVHLESVVNLLICDQLQTAYSLSMFLLHRDIQATTTCHWPLSSI